MTKRVTALFLSLGLFVGMASGPLAQPTHAASLKICGEVTVYVEATVLSTGLLTINGVPLVIAVGVDLPASVAVGADICVDLTTNGLGLITGATVTANAHAHLKICGDINAYVEATSSATGLLKVGSRTFTLGIGSQLPASVDVGADLCLDLELDGFGRVSDGTVEANAHVSVKICGAITVYAKATSSTTGALKIAGRTFTLAVDSDLPASVDVGANLCLDLTLDGWARVSDGEASANVQTHVKICGTVTAYAEATATALGSLRIAGRTFKMAFNSDLPASVDVDANLCLDLTLNGFAQVADGTAVANITGTLDVCGQVTAYVAATSITDGSLTHAGVTRKIAANANVNGQVSAAAYLKLRLVIDAFARIDRITVLKVGVSVADACGNAPQPTPGPGESQDPGQSQSPDATQPPASQPPASQPPASQPPASQPPEGSPAPDSSSSPDGSPSPSPDPDGIGDFLTGIGAGGSDPSDDTLLPDTDAIGRVTGVIASNAFPLIAIGLFGGLAAWYGQRQRRNDLTAQGLSIVDADSGIDEGPEVRS